MPQSKGKLVKKGNTLYRDRTVKCIMCNGRYHAMRAICPYCNQVRFMPYGHKVN